MKIIPDRYTNLPVKRGLTWTFAFSLTIAILMAAASIVGIIYGNAVYPTKELRETFVPNDIVNLFIGLPILLGSMWLARRGNLIGLLCLPGALFFVVYSYLTYVFAMPLNQMYLLYLVLVALSIYTLIRLVASIDGKAVQQQLMGTVHERVAGGVLTGLGILFFLRASSVIINSLTHGALVSRADLAVSISDFLITPAWIIGGISLWWHREFGYVSGLGLLFQASMLFIALIIVLLLQPLVTSVPFAIMNIVVIFIMGLICFIPFALFLRGAISKR